jgi:hypothetical protein
MPILRNVDIFAKVGKGTAYDEYIELDIRNNKVYIHVIIKNIIF